MHLVYLPVVSHHLQSVLNHADGRALVPVELIRSLLGKQVALNFAISIDLGREHALLLPALRLTHEHLLAVCLVFETAA